MLCIYFEIPYERQLVRIAPLEIQKLLSAVEESAKNNGASSFKMHCASVYRFSSNDAAPMFSANLFLQALAELLRVYKKRLIDYRVIIDCCEESDTDDSIADHFTGYKNFLIPTRSFFASSRAEPLLRSYISFEYVSKFDVYYCAHFIVPKINAEKTSNIPYRIYFPDTITWLRALYHFMLLHPLTDQAITEHLSAQDKKHYLETKNVQNYFRNHRFLTDYPCYFTDAFLTHIRLYFRVFAKSGNTTELTIVHTEKNAKEAERLLEILPTAHIELSSERPFNIDGLSTDFIQLAYLTAYASLFLFEDEIADFFLSLHKSAGFIAGVYEWMYAVGIIEVKNDIYSVNGSAFRRLERRLGIEKDKAKSYIAAFLWEKYKKGELCPDEELKNIFSTLQFQPGDQFLLHYFFHKYSDREIPQIDIRSFKSARFFTALESYQKALKINAQKDNGEAAYAVKNAIGAVQKQMFAAGEYRTLSCIAFLNLSQNKVEDAVTYLHYALDSAESLHDGGFICEALFNFGIGYFLQNNLQAAANCLTRLQQTLNDYFELSQKIPCMFMQGRIALQLGDYAHAELLFQEAEKAAAEHFQEWVPLCKIWYARTLSLKGQINKAREILISYREASPDASVFLIESYLFASVIHDDQMSMLPPVENFTTVNEPHRSGFALAEERVWGYLYGKPAIQICYTALNSYYRFRFAAELADDTAQAYLHLLEETAREALRHRDMYASIYAYLCYDAFRRYDGSDSDAANGYLSRSFKALQNCMDTMTENSIRDKFIFRNVWNARLYAAAQKNKLV